MKKLNFSPAEKKRYGVILLIIAAVFLLIAILFFRAGAANRKAAPEPTPPAPSSPVPSDVMPSDPTPDMPDVSAEPDSPDAPVESGTPEPSLPPVASPSPEIDLYEKLDFRPSSLYDAPKSYVVSSPDGELNVRTGPSTAYEKRGTLYSGTPVEVYTIESNWALIIFEDYYAWTSSNYLTEVTE